MFRTAVVLTALVLIPVSPAAGGSPEDDALKAWKKAYRRVLIEQKTYEAREMDRELRRAYATYIQPWLDRGKPDAPNVIEYDFSAYRSIYEKWAGFEKRKGELAVELAETDGPEVAERLVRNLLDVLSEIDRQDRAIANSKPKSFSVHDQPPAIRRYGALLHHDALVRALGTLRKEESLAWILDDGWKKAEKWERGRRRDLARIALLDALARTGTDAARKKLGEAVRSGERRIRLVALEGLATLPEDPNALRERLVEAIANEPAFAIRVAAIDLFRTKLPDPRAVPALAAALEKEGLGENGVLRAHLRRALKEIVGRDLGDSPDSWRAWYERNEKAIEDGTWEKGEDAGDDGMQSERDSVAFYDIRTLSKRLIVLVDASDTLIKPVDIEKAAKRNFFEWRAMAEKDRNYVSQYELLKRETLSMVRAFKPSARFNLVIMNGSSKLTPFWPRGMAEAEDAVKRRVEPFLDEVIVGGWAPQIQGIWEAYRMAGAPPWSDEIPDEPAADTFFLLSDGVPSGGQIMYGPAIVDDVRRRHRFQRIVIHTIRIDDYEDTAEEVMKGIADVTGGTYVWRKKP